jgi:hypothetical protein
MRDSTDVPDTSGLLERVTRERDAALALLELRTRERDEARAERDTARTDARINTIGECIAAACGAESLTEAIDAIADLNGRGGGHG